MSDKPTAFANYVTAVRFHLIRLATEENLRAQRQPTRHEIAWGRSNGLSPRKYAEWWVNRDRYY